MPTLDDILGNSAHISIPFGAESLNIDYRPDSITQETLVKLQNFTSTTDTASLQEQFTSLNQVIVDFLVGWDLLENDGVTVIPITVERLPKLPMKILTTVVEAIAEDMNPNSKAVQAQS